MKTKTIYTSIKILSMIGIVLALYLLIEQFFQPSFRPCNINATVNCEAIVSGPVAKTLGISTPLYGLVGYIIILISAFVQNRKMILGMATFGLLFCLWIAYQELILLRVICPVCIACQLVMSTLFVSGIYLNRK